MNITQEIVDQILDEIAGGKGLRTICAQDGMPDESTFRKYLSRNPEVKDLYFLAREMQADRYAEEIISLAGTYKDCTYFDKNGNKRFDNGAISAVSQQIDALKWVCSKLFKNVYGDSSNINLSGKVDNGREGVVTDAMLESIISKAMAEEELEDQPEKKRSHRGSKASKAKA